MTDIDDGIECDDDMYIDGHSPAFIHSVEPYNHSNQVLHSSPWQQGKDEHNHAVNNDLDLESNDRRYVNLD